MPHHILVASDSAYRRSHYVDELSSNGFEVTTASDGVDCVAKIRLLQPDVVLLELSLLWGGSRGVLAIRAEDAMLGSTPVVLVAVDGFETEWYESAQYPIQGFVTLRSSSDLVAATLIAAINGSERTSEARLSVANA